MSPLAVIIATLADILSMNAARILLTVVHESSTVGEVLFKNERSFWESLVFMTETDKVEGLALKTNNRDVRRQGTWGGKMLNGIIAHIPYLT
jgi:hypothetical protein